MGERLRIATDESTSRARRLAIAGDGTWPRARNRTWGLQELVFSSSLATTQHRLQDGLGVGLGRGVFHLMTLAMRVGTAGGFYLPMM